MPTYGSSRPDHGGRGVASTSCRLRKVQIEPAMAVHTIVIAGKPIEYYCRGQD